MQQHICDAVQNQTKLIGFEAATGGSVRERVSFVFFNHQLHPASVKVDVLININNL